MKNTETMLLRLDRELKRELRRIAKANELPVSAVVRRLLRHGIDATGGRLVAKYLTDQER